MIPEALSVDVGLEPNEVPIPAVGGSYDNSIVMPLVT